MFSIIESTVRFELTTSCLQNRCSAGWATKTFNQRKVYRVNCYFISRATITLTPNIPRLQTGDLFHDTTALDFVGSEGIEPPHRAPDAIFWSNSINYYWLCIDGEIWTHVVQLIRLVTKPFIHIDILYSIWDSNPCSLEWKSNVLTASLILHLSYIK